MATSHSSQSAAAPPSDITVVSQLSQTLGQSMEQFKPVVANGLMKIGLLMEANRRAIQKPPNAHNVYLQELQTKVALSAYAIRRFVTAFDYQSLLLEQEVERVLEINQLITKNEPAESTVKVLFILFLIKVDFFSH
jgi:hypothetical protein